MDRNSLDADSRDVVHVKIEIVDTKGYIVPDAKNGVQITVEGEGNLIGFDNGNPADHSSMKSNTRNVFNGLALAVIQSKNQPGVIHIKASSSDLKESTLDITLQKSTPAFMKVEDLKK